MPVALPMPKSGAGDISPDGSSKWSTRRCSATFALGSATPVDGRSKLYIFDLKTHAAEKITDDPGCHRDPMWIGDKILFLV